MIALGAMKAMAEFGIRIPEDVSIVGFDDLTFSSISYPPLTTLRVPKQEMGRAVVRRLRDMLKDNDGIKLKMQMCTQFIERESVQKKYKDASKNDALVEIKSNKVLISQKSGLIKFLA